MVYKIGVIEGDGIGPEIVNGSLRVVRELEKLMGVEFFETMPLDAGLKAFEKYGATYPDVTNQRLQECDGLILGPVSTHQYEGENMANPSAKIRKNFHLFANIRPIRSIPKAEGKFKDVDLVIVRENTEGMYADRNMADGSSEFMPDPDTVLSMRLVTRKASKKVAEAAFRLAQERNDKRLVSAVHKANVLKKGCGLFLEECYKVQSQYKDISIDDYHIDAFAMYLILHPQKYDVIVTTNMFGDILSDEAAGLVGGLGLAPSLNQGDQFAAAQAAHGSAPSIAGQGIANPIALLLSIQMLMNWLGNKYQDGDILHAASLLSTAVWNTLEESEIKTPDLGGNASTEEVCDEIISRVVQFV
ncbi:isocitrate/isopropylmalate dehydrogenase family protein [Bacillus massiliglaciei]|uniref:isocitrate/isopropylmalate dehydrogenase family protein n=1 Tax=Bacillus massiliglaciei TaxID=1816693 RepID=UPI000B14C723|nr:isocitrate/isopropylmalate dehydrogenase family protein [Bacillus massiliglaciei]